MPYSYKLSVFLTQTGVVLFLKVAHPPPEMAKFPPWGDSPQVGDHCSTLMSSCHDESFLQVSYVKGHFTRAGLLG